MSDLAIPDPTINSQITDSVTQAIRYKEGYGSGLPKTVQIRYMDRMTFDDAVLKYSNQEEFHIPSVYESTIISQYMRHAIENKNYLTTEIIDKDTVTVVNLFYGHYAVGSRKELYDLVLVYIQYGEE